MISKKTLLNNELIKEVISIRVNTLWKMLSLEQRGELPSVNEEGATGKYDNKGAIFIPGGLIFQDVDEKNIEYTSYLEKTAHAFRGEVRAAMLHDNAILLYPDGIASGINLDGGFFSKAARRIYTFKKAAFRRKKKIGSSAYFEVNSLDIIRSHCPTFITHPYGSRTRISTNIAACLIEPALYFAFCRTELNFCGNQSGTFTEAFDAVRDSVRSAEGLMLYTPHIVVCHDTRYSENSYTGLTRILGIGKFGEFCTFTLEKVNKKLLRELKRKNKEYSPEDFFAEYCGRRILGILRIYAPTNPGKRSTNYRLHLVSPVKDLGINTDQIAKEAREQYHIKNK
ncbi:MAG: hypothetical protein U9P36_11780 [Thermodesulfobacteriota bacterium]|nr:hypothetical protein [Thermodesulfobacteriota bacterium]